MTNYPGENEDIPKRLLESMQNVPLTFLVPKDGLASVVKSSISSSLVLTSDEISSTKSNNHENHTENTITDESILNFYKNNLQEFDDDTQLLFKRPNNLKNGSTSNTDKDKEINLFEKLSPLAKRCLLLTKTNVSKQNIVHVSSQSQDNELKRKISEISNTSLDLSDLTTGSKRTKISTGVTINELSLADEFVKDLENIIEILGNDIILPNYNDLENWLCIDLENNYVTTELLLEKIQLNLRNILNIGTIQNRIDLNHLTKIMDTMVCNITLATELKNNTKINTSFLRKIAHLSIVNIFTIFLFKRDAKQLYLEQYFLKPINFLQEALEFIKISFKENEHIRQDVQLLHQSIQLIPSYIYQNPYLDEELITRLTYLFVTILMENDIEFINNSVCQHSWNSIKLISSEVLIALFDKIPAQRTFILKELLSSIDNIPTKRLQKKMRRISNDKFATYFTTTVLRMLETLNCYDSLRKLSELSSDTIPQLSLKQQKTSESISFYINLICGSIFDKFVKNSSKTRHILDTFVQDILTLFTSPEWPISVVMLSNIWKKLIDIFSPGNSSNSIIETASLNWIGLIGSAVFEVKCNTRENEANNITQLCNYPENIEQYLSSFEKCIDFVASESRNTSTEKYLICLELEKLIQIDQYLQDSEQINPLISQHFEAILSRVTLTNSLLLRADSFDDVTLDYFSIMHSTPLIPLYEPFLNLLLTILNSNKIKLRSTAIKCLSLLASKDKSILSNPIVKSAITDRLTDSSTASVRDAILDLICIGSSHIDFYKQINMSYNDDSVLIRKHILKINEMIYDDTNDIEIKVFVAAHILLKSEDEEDSIIEIVRANLLKKWIVSLDSSGTSDEKIIQDYKNVITVLAGIVSFSKKVNEVFDWFLNFYLLNKELHSEVIYQKINSTLNVMTDVLVQCVIESEASDNESAEPVQQKKNLLNLLALFADASISFITKDHIIGLYPYLLSNEKSILHHHILHVFNTTLKKLSNFKAKFLIDLEEALLNGLSKMNVAEIDETIPILWCISIQRNDRTRLSKACLSCLIMLHSYVNKANNDPLTFEVDPRIQRLLFLATGFARFCDLDTVQDNLTVINEKDSLYEYMAKCLLVLSRSKLPLIIRRTSIKNLVRLCGSHPKLFNSKHILNLLDGEFKGDNVDIKLLIVEGLFEFFQSEEHNSIRKSGVNRSFSSRRQLTKSFKATIGNQGNDGICSALIAKFLTPILHIVLLPEFKYAVVAIKLLQLVLECGYVNPVHCIPTVIALLCSPDNYLQALAEKILAGLFEKYETLVFNGITKGTQEALAYSKRIDLSSFYKNDNLFSAAQSIFGKNKKNEPKFHRYIEKIINNSLNDVTDVENNEETIDIILFLSSNISNIIFSNQFYFYKVFTVLDFTEEQLRDSTLEILRNTSEKEWNKKSLRASILIQTVLHNLKLYISAVNGIDSEKFYMSPAEESELKQKLITERVSTDMIFSQIIDGCLSTINETDLFYRYLHDQRYID